MANEPNIVAKNGGKPQKRYKPVFTVMIVAKYSGETTPPITDQTVKWHCYGIGTTSRTKDIEGETTESAYFLTANDEPDGNTVEEKTSTTVTLSDEGVRWFGNDGQQLIYDCAMATGDDNKCWLRLKEPTGREEYYLASVPKLSTGGDSTAFEGFTPEFSLGAPVLVIEAPATFAEPAKGGK